MLRNFLIWIHLFLVMRNICTLMLVKLKQTLDLPTGKHTLQLLLGDEDHEPQDPPLISEKITITVE